MQTMLCHPCRYFRRLQRRYAADRAPSAGTKASGKARSNGAFTKAHGDLEGLQTPITCINLLRCNMQVMIYHKPHLPPADRRQEATRS